jgi:hypothetical protein
VFSSPSLCVKSFLVADQVLHDVHISRNLNMFGAKVWPAFMARRLAVKRDAVLVMGTDEADLLKSVVRATVAVQRRPWRWDVDWWRSSMNVDLKFLEWCLGHRLG